MGAVAAQIEVDRIMSSVDMDANGAIDYTEFISATINKSKLLTKERLKTAFDHFDKVLNINNFKLPFLEPLWLH
jgi:calcium-dependent protein kinase